MHSIDLVLSLALTMAIAGGVFLVAGFVKGVVGLGLPTISMGLLSLVMAPAQAAALVIVPSLVTNVWQIAARPGLAGLTRRIAPLLVGLCAGVALGTGWLTGAHAGAVGAALGFALLLYSALGLLSVQLHVPPRHEAWTSSLAGVATGLVTAATGVFVIPSVPYLQALGLEKDELVQALGISFLVATVALAASLGHGGALPTTAIGGSLLALVPALLGMGAGQRLRSRMHPQRFKKVFLAGLLLLGAGLALRGLGAL
ncbi:MAG TPA: sulfite exporter TauE/SafE family protein [Albitalea sp.]|nr:sulfite exporter TauE/SafE family protein [Albitalea sp.]